LRIVPAQPPAVREYQTRRRQGVELEPGFAGFGSDGLGAAQRAAPAVLVVALPWSLHASKR